MAAIPRANGRVTAMSPEEERQALFAISQEGDGQIKEGDMFYIMSVSWWAAWSAYVHQTPTNGSNNGPQEGSGNSYAMRRPLKIDNCNLIRPTSITTDYELKDALVEGTDYILLPEGVWNQILAWYGGGPALPRKVITSGLSQTQLTVEVYPLRLLIHMLQRNDIYVIRMSRKETVGALYRRACEIFHIGSNQVRIWNFYNLQRHYVLTSLSQTLENANLVTEQDILVEVVPDCSDYPITAKRSRSADVDPIASVEPSRRNGASRRGLIGLLNLNNTCYMNSALQCLVHTPQLTRYFHGDFYGEINWRNPLGLQGELAFRFGELLRDLWVPGRAVFCPLVFHKYLPLFAPQFTKNNQHDSQELLAFLLDGLHEDLNRVKQKPYVMVRDADGRPDEEVADEYWANHVARNDSIIVDVCQGQYKSSLTCPVCDKVSVTFDPFMYLSLPLESDTPRMMTVTVFSCDVSAMPVTYTVNVPELGHCRHLTEKLAETCWLKQDEKFLLAEIQDHFIHWLYEDPFMSLSVIKNDAQICAYKIPKSTKNTKYLQLVNRRAERVTNNGQITTVWKPIGTPLVHPISSDARITQGDIQLIAHTMLKPKNSAVLSPSLKLRLKLVAENDTLIDISNEEQRAVKFTSYSDLVVVYIDWTPGLLSKYKMPYLEKLPQFYDGKRKACDETLSLYACLEAFLREEPLVTDDMWFCPRCKEQRQAVKKLDLWRLPEVLVIHLKRFSYSTHMNVKLETFVNFPFDNFDLTKYIANKSNSDPQVYQLYGVINHSGDMGGGHYTAYVKLFDENKWYEFNDNYVFEIDTNNVRTEAAYVLFYTRVKSDGPLVNH